MLMATSSVWSDIDNKFCLCSICREQFKEPKLLPCLHRFCKDCLGTLLQARDGILKCPECREEIQLPPNGVNGFRTDFYMRNLVEYVQIQQSLQGNEIRECYSCLKHLKAAAYCFKCNNFLCTDCFHAHMTNNTLNDHKQHTLSVKDIESKHLTPKILASMRDAPRCHIHPSKVSELCCETCDNVTVCMACMLGKHRGHDLHEVTEFARFKRQMLAEQLKDLDKMKAERDVIAPSKIKDMLIENVTNEKEKLEEKYRDVVMREEIVLKCMEKRLELTQDWKETEKRKVFDPLQNEMEREIQEVKDKYKEIYKVKEKEINDQFSTREKGIATQITKLNQNLEQLDKDKKEVFESIEQQLRETLQTVDATRIQFEIVTKRFESLHLMASNVFASENDWTAVQCMPNLCTTAVNLMEDLKKEFAELETLTNVKLDYQHFFNGKPSFSKIIGQGKEKVTIGFTDCYLNGATGIDKGNIVITGCIRSGIQEPFVIVIDENGKIIKQKKMTPKTAAPWHVCDSFSRHKVALACEPNTIGVYNICDGSYFELIISDVIGSWPANRKIRCVAADPVNSRLLVGGKSSRDVYVFDDQLNYLHILTLPSMIKWPRDMTVRDGHLLVCDYDGKKAYITTMEELGSRMAGEFITPDLDIDDLRPWSVCTDKDGFVFILWKVPFVAQSYLVQYFHDGSRVLATREVGDDAKSVTVVQTDQGEKLSVLAHKRNTMYLFSLTEED